MILDELCPPAILYVAFSLTHIVIDLFKNLYNTAFLKFIVMIIFTLLLNILCQQGLDIVSWFIVFIPFIMMTVISSVLLFMFGLSPRKGNYKYNVEYPHRKKHGYHHRRHRDRKRGKDKKDKDEPKPHDGDKGKHHPARHPEAYDRKMRRHNEREWRRRHRRYYNGLDVTYKYDENGNYKESEREKRRKRRYRRRREESEYKDGDYEWNHQPHKPGHHRPDHHRPHNHHGEHRHNHRRPGHHHRPQRDHCIRCNSYMDCDGGNGYCNTCENGMKCCGTSGGNSGCP